MPAAVRTAIGAAALLMLAAATFAARAQQAQPAAPAPAAQAQPAAPAPAAPAPAAPAPAAPGAPPEPSQAALAAADSVLTDMGIKRTLELIVPGMLTELERNVTTTRPEIKAPLRDALRSIQPEFDKSAQEMYAKATALMVTMLSEKEIEDVAAFFSSPTGKKYLAAEPQFMQRFGEIVEPWREQLSTDIVTRARQEMKKKGLDF
jgi:uncharacterized protein